MIRRIILSPPTEKRRGLELRKGQAKVELVATHSPTDTDPLGKPTTLAAFPMLRTEWEALVDRHVHGEETPEQPAVVHLSWGDAGERLWKYAALQFGVWWGIRRAVGKAGGPPWAVKLAGRLALLVAAPQSQKAAGLEKEVLDQIVEKATVHVAARFAADPPSIESVFGSHG